jgi:hypothetical protein
MLKINVEFKATEIAIGEGLARQLHIPDYFTFKEKCGAPHFSLTGITTAGAIYR